VTLDPAGTRLGKRASERAKRRKQRRRLTAAGVVAVVVLLVLVSAVLITNGGKGGGKKAVATRTQHTLLLQIKGSDGTAVGSALLAHDPKTKSGVVVLVPPEVLPNGSCGNGQAFGKLLQTASPTTSRNTLADLMGIVIDGSWVLDGTTFSQLVDQLGGIRATVDAPVISGRTILLQQGAQQLSGANALLFATYLGPQEQEQTRLTRLQAVIAGILAKLPADPENVVKGLGGGSQLTTSPASLSDLLTGLTTDDAAGNLQNRSLPVTPRASGNDDIHFGLNAAETRSLVDDVLAGSILPGARMTDNRVFVSNGVGTPGLNEQVRDKLVKAGFVCVGSNNAQSFGNATTQVLVPESTEESAALGERVAKAIGVPTSSVRTSNKIGTIADVFVIVGKDFSAK
jgi:anionic cell wall polymer biosynthesis LytR-Cps2A-Psr (LCP) family protein